MAYVAEMSPAARDDAVLDHAERTGSVLVTADKDFGELVFRQHRVTSGVVLVRLPGLSASAKVRIVSAALLAHGKRVHQAFAVISAGMVRIRREL